MKKTILVFAICLMTILVQSIAFAEVGKDQNYAGAHLSAVKLTGGDNDLSTVRSWIGIKYGHYFTPIVAGEINVSSGFVIPRRNPKGGNWYSDQVNGFDDLTKTYLIPIELNARFNAVANSPLIPFARLGLGVLNWTVRDVTEDNSSSHLGTAGDKLGDIGWTTNFFGKIGAGFEIWFAGPVTLELSANYITIFGQNNDMFALDKITAPNNYIYQDELNDILAVDNGIDEPNGAIEGRVAMNVHFGGKQDKDGDGIYDKEDGCPTEPEDVDGYQDADGCPDRDNDGDGILDVDDQCPNDAEDKDGFEDEDGCPDLDNDQDGIPDKDDACPDDPEDFDGFEDEDGCPELDMDGDGILDTDDSCPGEVEDFDGFEDEDGCPDPDNDGDGILDVNDDCPNEAETFNEYEDEDGCPDTVPEVIFKKDAPIILEGVNFEFNSAELTAGAKEVLMKVVRTLKDYPEMTLMIKGHTDSMGSDEYNLGLSDRRANSVKQYLVNQGIDPLRLTSKGYGEAEPIAPNDTAEGRAKNRRIEFYRTN